MSDSTVNSPKELEDIMDFIRSEAKRIEYGKLMVECTVLKGRVTNVQAETKRSKNINQT
jgi:hypothetical protein